MLPAGENRYSRTIGRSKPAIQEVTFWSGRRLSGRAWHLFRCGQRAGSL